MIDPTLPQPLNEPLPLLLLLLLSPPLPLCQIKKQRASVELRAVCECKQDSAILWGACAIHLLTHSFTHPHTLIHTFIHATINSYCSLLSTASASTSALGDGVGVSVTACGHKNNACHQAQVSTIFIAICICLAVSDSDSACASGGDGDWNRVLVRVMPHPCHTLFKSYLWSMASINQIE